MVIKNSTNKNNNKIATNKNSTQKTTNYTKMELLPLTIPSDEGIIFKLAEPINEPDVV